MNLKLVLCTGALLGLAACAGSPEQVWDKPGANRDAFSQDRYACMQRSQQRVSDTVVNAFGGYSTDEVVTNDSLYSACMNARGWYLVAKPSPAPQPVAPAAAAAAAAQPQAQSQAPAPVRPGPVPTLLPNKPPPKSSAEKLRELNAQLAQEGKAICATAEFALVVARSPCRREDIGAAQVADETKLSDGDRAAFVKLFDALNNLRQRAYAGVQVLGEKYSVAWAAAMKKDSDSQAANAQELLQKGITWGAYNQRRIEIGKAYLADEAKARSGP